MGSKKGEILSEREIDLTEVRRKEEVKVYWEQKGKGKGRGE